MDLAKIDYTSKEVIQTLKQTVAQGATDQEFEMFRQFCQSTGLNPFKKEIWFIKAGSRVQIMTGINGFLAIANSHPQYDGMEVDVELDAQGRPVKAIAKAYRKDRRFPSVGIALMKESVKDTPTWREKPSHMLAKCAKAIALREAFPQELNGLYAQEEMPADFAPPAATSEQPKTEAQVVEAPSKAYYYDINLMGAERDRAFAYVTKLGLTRNEQGYWVSDVPRKHIEKCEVTAHVNNGKVEPMEVAQNG